MLDVLIGITCRNYERYLTDALVWAGNQGCPVLVAHDKCDTNAAPVGVAMMRNKLAAYAAVKGFSYVIFLDADDAMSSGYVAALLREANGDECVVTCDARVFGDYEGTIAVKRPITLQGVLALNTIHVSALISTSLFDKHGGFDPTLDAYEDWDMWCRFLANGVEFRYSSTATLNIRRHANSRHAKKKTKLDAMRDYLRRRHQETAISV